ncbi:hypothetical protein ANCCAN_05112 [Ancylostoma caninum]|uniref:Uncharacterized protein n=1 Tax=Ancylostoma caninum TaxID=29170 RepID=A0A368GZQ5_ANCCA|nr:hypothetical protein ANCCAN_05112 [Ancylostoma caninum]
MVIKIYFNSSPALKTISISAYDPEEVTNTYKISVKAMPPSNGEFKAFVRRVRKQFEMASASVDRLDRFGSNGKCTSDWLKHLCHCKVKEKKAKTSKKP